MSELRIIGGKARGRRIHSIPGQTTRPITDKVKEALFNIIGPDIQGAYFLDLFAGTGSVGIEALSRDAAHVCFVERNRKPFNIIHKNLKLTGLEQGAVVMQANAFVYLEKPVDHPYDYIFIAPPQYKELWIKTLQSLDTHIDWLAKDAWVIVQIHPVEYQPLGEEMAIRNIEEFDQRSYGSTLLVFYHRLTVR